MPELSYEFIGAHRDDLEHYFIDGAAFLAGLDFLVDELNWNDHLTVHRLLSLNRLAKALDAYEKAHPMLHTTISYQEFQEALATLNKRIPHHLQ